jgi:hypothetical protein
LNYTLELLEDLQRRRNHPTFHASLLRPYEPNDEFIFPSREANRFYDFGMPDDQQWHVEEILTHQWTGTRTVKLRIKWTAGDITWEPVKHLDDCQALDDYFETLGVRQWQDLPRAA